MAGPQTQGMELKPLGEVLRDARKNKRMRQIDLAQALSVDRHWISDVERGVVHPDKIQRGLMARALEMPAPWLHRLEIPPTEPNGALLELLCPYKPRYQPRGEQPTWKRLLSLWRHDRERLSNLWEALRKRSDWPAIRRFLVHVQTDSRYEVLLWLILLVAGVVPTRVAPQRCGYRASAIINPDTLEVVGDCRVPALVSKSSPVAVILPQQTLHTTAGRFRPDALVGVRGRTGLRWCALECDGEGHDTWGDAGRETQLKLKVVRFSSAELLGADFDRLFWARVMAAVELG